jgi:hypothetical protein
MKNCSAILTILLLHFAFLGTLQAQDKKKSDSIIDLRNKVALYYAQTQNLSGFYYQGIDYKIAGGIQYGMGISTRHFSYVASTSLGEVDKNGIPVRTKTFAQNLNLSPRRFLVNLAFLNYTGYRFETDSLRRVRMGNQSDFRNDIWTKTRLVNFLYVFNHKRFNHAAGYDYTKRALKNSGSLVAGFIFSHYRLGADSLVLPWFYRTKNSEDKQLTGIKLINYGPNMGYMHRYCIGKKKKWFLNWAFITGVSSYNSTERYADRDNEEKTEGSSLQIIMKFAYGWLGDDFFFVANGSYTENMFFFKNQSFTHKLTFINVTFGMRIYEPRPLAKLLDRVEEAVPLLK